MGPAFAAGCVFAMTASASASVIPSVEDAGDEPALVFFASATGVTAATPPCAPAEGPAIGAAARHSEALSMRTVFALVFARRELRRAAA